MRIMSDNTHRLYLRWHDVVDVVAGVALALLVMSLAPSMNAKLT
jgi:hypothetical protein